MSGGHVHRGRLPALGALLTAVCAAGIWLASAAATASATAPHTGLRLPAPVREVDPLATPQLGLRPDRLLTSQVPGAVRDTESVLASLGPSGAPATVTDTQRLRISAQGNYIVRELGPARQAVGLGGSVPPVLELGTVVWQGFSPGHRELAARLTLDPGIEAARLPMRVQLQFHAAGTGRVQPLGPGARAPTAGTVTVTLVNNTASSRTVDSGVADPGAAARALDTLQRAAVRPHAAVPPTAGHGLPVVVPGRTTGRLALDVVAPLRVTGALLAPGGSGAISGPATTSVPGGVAVAGTLTGSAQFTVKLRAGERLLMHLDVRPWLDPRTLAPPAPYRRWSTWARHRPSAADVAHATSTLVQGAAAAARSAEYSPYLQADAPGPDLSTFTYVVAPTAAISHAVRDVQPRPGAIAATAVAVLAVLGNAALLRRRL